MATVISTEIKVYAGTTTSGSQIGNTITDSTSGGPASVALNSTSLGVALSAGEQYCVVARCTNDEQVTSEWTQPYPFKTLIFAELLTFTGGTGTLSPEMQFTYNNQVLSVSECGVYISVNASGANAQRIAASDEQEAEQGWQITGVQENTTYYAVPFVVDSLGREYKGDWNNAESASTGYAAPTVVISPIVTDYNSLSGNVTVTSNDTIASVTLSIIPTGGGGGYQYKTLVAQTGMQPWSVTNGDLDDQNNPIVINPSTEYRITINAVNTTSGNGSDTKTATTTQQETSTISITSVTNVTPTSATVNLSYGNGGAVLNPEQNS